MSSTTLESRVLSGLPDKAGATQEQKRLAKDLMLLCVSPDGLAAVPDRVACALSRLTEWDFFLNLVEENGVASLVAHNLDVAGVLDRIPSAYRGCIERSYQTTLYRNMMLTGALQEIIAAFNRGHIPSIVLKGTVLAERLYGNPGVRPSGDIDILVPPEASSQAGQVLRGLEYCQATSSGGWVHPFHEAPYIKQGIVPLVIELHRGLEDKKLAAISADEIWRHAVPIEIQGTTTKVLSPAHTILFSAYHMCKHSRQTLKSLADIAQMVKMYRDTVDWQAVIDTSRAWEIDGPVYFPLLQAREWLGAPVPDEVLRELRPKRLQRFLPGFLVSQQFVVFPTRQKRLRDETFTMARCLMMGRFRKAMLIITRNRRNKRAALFRAAAWLVLVVTAAIFRNTLAAADGRDALT